MQRPKRNNEYHALDPETSPVNPTVEFRLNKNFSWLRHELDKMPVRKDPDSNPAVAGQRGELWEWNELLRHTVQDIQNDTLTLLYDLRHDARYAPQAPVEKPKRLFVPIIPNERPKKIYETLDQAQEELFRYAESWGPHKPTRPMDDPKVKQFQDWIDHIRPWSELDKELQDNPELFEEAKNAIHWYKLMSKCIIHELPVEYLEN